MKRLQPGTKLCAATLITLAAGVAGAVDVVRTPLPVGNGFSISAAVPVAAGLDTVYLSAALPSIVNQDALKGSAASYGDMETRTAFAGLMAGYKLSLGTAEQPDRPALSAVQVAELVAPGTCSEVEVIGAKSHAGPDAKSLRGM